MLQVLMIKKRIPVRRLGATVVALAIVVASGDPVVAQDSLSRTGCLPGDATQPWQDGPTGGSSEQCDAYVVDLDAFQTSWGTSFGIAPIVKSSKTSLPFFSSLISAQTMSRHQRKNQPFPRATYSFWSEPGFGVNNDLTVHSPGAPIDTAGALSNQFAVAFTEFATTDLGASHTAIVGALVNYLPTDPGRLYVLRNVAAINACSGGANLSQFGLGTVDASGNIHFRADCFQCTGGEICGLTNLSDNNVFQVNMAARDCSTLNVISNDYPNGLFDADATRWIVRNSATVFNPPNIMPASLRGGTPLLIGANFDTQYARGEDFPVAVDQTHFSGTNVIDHRGNPSYSPDNCAFLENTHGMAALLARHTGPCNDNECTDTMLIWGLDVNGSVTGTHMLQLPQVIVDNADGFMNLIEPGSGLPNEFNSYRSQVAFRGGNGQVALGTDQAGRLLAAGQVDHPFGGFVLGVENEWDINYIAVARTDCESGNVEWTMAGYNGIDTNGDLLGKPILDGPDGNMIGFMRPITGDGTGGGPAVTSPMIDSAGNVWFVTAAEFNDNPGNWTRALVRAVYDPDTFSYELELVLRRGDVFHGQNSDRSYEVSFFDLMDFDSISSGAVWSQNISAVGHLGEDPAGLATNDPRTLGGLVIAAEVTYDYDQDEDFEECTEGGTGDDQDYNVLLYIGALDPGSGCESIDSCDDGNVCTQNRCDASICAATPRDYGDVNGDDATNIFDVLCSLDGSQGEFEIGCNSSNVDIEPCAQNGVVDLNDVNATLSAFAGVDPCCAAPTGACCAAGTCQDDVSADECIALSGEYQGDETTCTETECPQVGACCTLEACSDGVSEMSCLASGGEYQGDNSSCDGFTCPAIGACCEQGVCIENRSEGLCLENGGVYQGDGSACDQVDCPVGACCIAGACMDDEREIDCLEAGGSYQGHDSTCGDVECPPAPPIRINEIRIDNPGTNDNEYFELTGAPGASLGGLTYLVIGDGVGGSGVIDTIVNLTGLTMPASGYLVVAEPDFELGTPDATRALNFENSDNVTHLLVAGFTGTFAQDLDTNDDGTLDETPWSGELDRIALIEENNPPINTEWHYGPPTVGPDGIFVPAHALRCPDTDGAWEIGQFDSAIGTDTPGLPNVCPNTSVAGSGSLMESPTIMLDARTPTAFAGGSLIIDVWACGLSELRSFDLKMQLEGEGAVDAITLSPPKASGRPENADSRADLSFDRSALRLTGSLNAVSPTSREIWLGAIELTIPKSYKHGASLAVSGVGVALQDIEGKALTASVAPTQTIDVIQAGAPTIALRAAGELDNEVQVSPGQMINVEAYLTGAAGHQLRGYQVTLPAMAAGGSAGMVVHDGNAPSINEARADYLFNGVANTFVTSKSLVAPAVAVGTYDEDAVNGAGEHYLGSFTYIVGNSAAGTHELTPQMDESFLVDQDSTGLTYGTIGLAINVGCSTAGDCDDGSFCNGVENCLEGSCVAGTTPCPGTPCDEGADVCCAYGDADCDSEVDLTDYASLFDCLTGPNVPMLPGCGIHDANVDGDVDLDDAAVFNQVFGDGQ